MLHDGRTAGFTIRGEIIMAENDAPIPCLASFTSELGGAAALVRLPIDKFTMNKYLHVMKSFHIESFNRIMHIYLAVLRYLV